MKGVIFVTENQNYLLNTIDLRMIKRIIFGQLGAINIYTNGRMKISLKVIYP